METKADLTETCKEVYLYLNQCLVRHRRDIYVDNPTFTQNSERASGKTSESFSYDY